MKRNLKSLAVVSPFYNEETGIHAFYEALCDVLDSMALELTFIFVDDGSQDATLEILNAIADKDERVRVLSLARNFGYQVALTAGLDHANAEAVVTLDSDLQHPPTNIIEMIRKFETGVEIVYGVRLNQKNRTLVKRITAQIFDGVLSRVSKVHMINGATDFRLISKTALDALTQMREVHRYLRGMVPWLGLPYTIVYYEQSKRHADGSRYGWGQLLRLGRAGLSSFSTAPLDMVTGLGLIVLLLALAYLIIVLFRIVFLDIPLSMSESTAIIASILTLSGVQLISIGILAQYIGMIFQEVKRRPLYILKQGPHNKNFLSDDRD